MDPKYKQDMGGYLEDLAFSASAAWQEFKVGNYDEAADYLRGPLPTIELIEMIEDLAEEESE